MLKSYLDVFDAEIVKMSVQKFLKLNELQKLFLTIMLETKQK